MEYNVKIDAFEGPLDLLLHLVNRLEIDIYDISVSQITDQYLDFIHQMQELQLDVAAEYLLMAATLLEMKSKMLLPAREEEPLEEEFDVEYEEDPREELIRRLVEYRKYKIVTEQLKKRGDQWILAYSKPPVPLGEPEVKQLADASIYDMISALQKLVKRIQLEVPKQTKIRRQEISVKERMDDILRMLDQRPGMRTFDEFHTSSDREHLVSTFLAVLELMKKRLVTCEQRGNFADIVIYKTEAGERDGTQINH
ncbi:MAG TPA: segregation/condensation protein A [Bacillales bacterium]|nr:segregation/condensation protein A [Bacillales bacterium]